MFKKYCIRKELKKITIENFRDGKWNGTKRVFYCYVNISERLKNLLNLKADYIECEYSPLSLWQDFRYSVIPVDRWDDNDFMRLKILDNLVMEYAEKQKNTVMELQYFEPENEEWTIKTKPANLLPAGWLWKDYGDGSGCLDSPEGKSYFSYDLMPYHSVRAVEYQKDKKSGWNIYWEGFKSFQVFAEVSMAMHLGLKWKMAIYNSNTSEEAIMEKAISGPEDIKGFLADYEGYWCRITEIVSEAVVLEGAFAIDFLHAEYYKPASIPMAVNS